VQQWFGSQVAGNEHQNGRTSVVMRIASAFENFRWYGRCTA
jgi:hypothetical protein